jgi:hypothetical protein
VPAQAIAHIADHKIVRARDDVSANSRMNEARGAAMCRILAASSNQHWQTFVAAGRDFRIDQGAFCECSLWKTHAAATRSKHVF